MMKNEDLLEAFYSSFQKGDPKTMASCYHDSAAFNDPAFGRLHGKEIGTMWTMLLSRRNSDLKIEYSGISADRETGRAQWVATYRYGVKKRLVVNKIRSHFKFQNGKIHEQVDDFDLWAWSRQALGPIGLLMGWTPWLQKKIREMARKSLHTYMNEPS